MFGIVPLGTTDIVARSVGTTPFGVFRNSGSFNRRRSRPKAWLTAEVDKFNKVIYEKDRDEVVAVEDAARRFEREVRRVAGQDSYILKVRTSNTKTLDKTNAA